MFAAERDRDNSRTRSRRCLAARARAPTLNARMPREDKTEAVNAQFEAEEFNRKLGAKLHAVVAGDFPPRR